MNYGSVTRARAGWAAGFLSEEEEQGKGRGAWTRLLVMLCRLYFTGLVGSGPADRCPERSGRRSRSQWRSKGTCDPSG